MPQARVVNLTPNTRVSNLTPNFRISSRIPDPSSSIFITAGSPIGLLLSLTYSASTEVIGPSDLFRPNIRITNI